MNISKIEKHIYTILWLIILLAFGLAILHINISKNPDFYCTDMYSDMVYATQVWEKRSLFPDGWVFGNQLYAVATPVLAALFFGILQDPCIAMGIASTLMGIGVIYSFCWMLKPLFTELHERLFASVLLMTLVLLCGDPIYAINGWQLLFTMCSYYACYAITVFLAFGCYIRSNFQWKVGLHFILACVLSFGTGVQSLRQTAIMIIPLIAVECLKLIHDHIYIRKYSYKSALIVIVLSVSNLVGILYAKSLDINKNEIFGSMSFCFPSNLGKALWSCFSTPFMLFSSYSKFTAIVFSITCICVAIIFFRKHDWHNSHFFLCIFLHIISIWGILFLDIFTTMNIREIYYFMLYPLTAIIFTFVYARSMRAVRLLALILIICTLPSCVKKLSPHILTPQNDHPMQQVSDFLDQNEITTIYSHWNFGEKIAIASNFDIRVGFWDYSMDVFNSVKYLCNPSIFDADISHCAYVVSGKGTFNKATEVAEERGARLHLMQHFPEFDIFIFTADQKLMN